MAKRVLKNNAVRSVFLYLMLLGGCLFPLYAVVYEMPQISVKGKKIKNDGASIDTVQNGFKTQSIRHIDQGQLHVFMDGIPIQNGCLPINLALFDKAAKSSTDHSVGDILYTTEKPSQDPKLECTAAYGSFKTYKSGIRLEGGAPTTQAGLQLTQTGMNGRSSIARRYQLSPFLEGSDKEIRQHLTARADHQTEDMQHTISFSHHNGRYTYKAIPFDDFDSKHPRWEAIEKFEHICYKATREQNWRTHGILAGFAEQKRDDMSKDDIIKNSFQDTNIFIQQTNTFAFNPLYKVDLNIAYLLNRYKSNFENNQVEEISIENIHHIQLNQTHVSIHLKGVHNGAKNSFLNAAISMQYPLNKSWQIFSKMGMYHRPPLIAQKFHPVFKNPNLKSQQAITVDGGYQFAFQQHQFKQSLFFIQIKNYIDLIGNCYENARSLKSYGLESSYAFTHTPWRVTAQYTYARIKADKVAFMCRKPKNKAKIDITYTVNEKLKLTGSVDYFGPHEDLESYKNPIINCPSITTVGACWDYQYSQSTNVFCNVENLLNRKYDFPQGYHGKPFFISIGIKIRLYS